MSHFATTALFRKRTGEKRNEKHHEKTSKSHADSIFHAFWSILAQFLEMLCFTKALPGFPGVWGVLWRLRAPPAPFGTCHDAFGTCFVARATCKKSRNFGKCGNFSNFPEKNADFHENCYFFNEIPSFLASDFRGISGQNLLGFLHRNSGQNL